MRIHLLFTLNLFFMVGCNYGLTPSSERLQKAARVQLPEGSQVLRDEYQDMGQDYVVYYDIKLRNDSIAKFIKSIQNSGVYSSEGQPMSTFQESNNFRIWYRTGNRYEFEGKLERVLYSISLDTSTCIMKYEEFVL